MRRHTLLLAATLLLVGCAAPPPSASPTPPPSATPTPQPSPTLPPEPTVLAPLGPLISSNETPLPARTALNLLLPKGGAIPQLISDGGRLYLIAAPSYPLIKEGASAGADYALYSYDLTTRQFYRVSGTKAPRELGRPKEVATETATDPINGSTWSIVYAGGVCYRANGSYTSSKPTNAYLYAYDRQLSLEATKGERGRCIFSEYPLYPAPVRPWSDASAPTRLCPPDRPDCARESGTLSVVVSGPVDPRAATDAALPMPTVAFFTTAFTGSDGTVTVDTLRFLKRNGTSGELRYGNYPLEGSSSAIVLGADGAFYAIVRSYGDPANRWFLARIDPADPRALTPLTSPPTR